MKITHVDYNAIANANASKFNFKQISLANEKFHRDLDYVEDMDKLQQSSRDIQSIASLGSALLNFTGKAIQYSEQKQLIDADPMMSGFQNAMQEGVADAALNGGPANFDENNNVVLNEDLQSLKEQQQQTLDEYEASPKVKEALQKQFNSMWSGQEHQLAMQIKVASAETIGANRELDMDEAIAADSKTDGYKAVTSLIDSWTDQTPEQKAYNLRVGKMKVDDARIDQLAVTETPEKANSFIDSLDYLTDAEKEVKKANAKGLYDKQTSNIMMNEVENFRAYMDAGTGSIESYRANLEARLDSIPNMTESRKATIMQAIDTVQEANAIEQMQSVVKNLETMPNYAIEEIRKSVSEGGASDLFAGIPTVQNTYLNMLDKQLKENKSAERAISEADQKELNAAIDAATELVLGGKIAPKDAYDYINVRASLLGTLEADVAAEKFYNKVITNAKLPASISDAVITAEKGFEKEYQALLKRKHYEGDIPVEVAAAKRKYHEHVLSYVVSHPADDITEDDIKTVLKEAKELYFGEVLTASTVEKAGQRTSTAIDHMGDVSYKSLEKQLELLADTENAASADANTGDIAFNKGLEGVFGQVELFTIGELMPSLGIEPSGLPAVPMMGEDGKLSAMPIFTDSSGNRYTFTKNGDFYNMANPQKVLWSMKQEQKNYDNKKRSDQARYHGYDPEKYKPQPNKTGGNVVHGYNIDAYEEAYSNKRMPKTGGAKIPYIPLGIRTLNDYKLTGKKK